MPEDPSYAIPVTTVSVLDTPRRGDLNAAYRFCNAACVSMNMQLEGSSPCDLVSVRVAEVLPPDMDQPDCPRTIGERARQEISVYTPDHDQKAVEATCFCGGFRAL